MKEVQSSKKTMIFVERRQNKYKTPNGKAILTVRR